MIRFPGQYPDEKIILAVRRHWFVLLMRAVPVIILVVSGIIAYLIINTYWPAVLRGNWAPAVVLAFVSFAMVVWTVFYIIWIDYYFDIWLVTSYRIIDVQQKGLFNRVISEQNLERVQDVSSAITGLVPTLFNYGEVSIQTAGTAQRFQFEQVPHPNRVKKAIIDLARGVAERVEIVRKRETASEYHHPHPSNPGRYAKHGRRGFKGDDRNFIG